MKKKNTIPTGFDDILGNIYSNPMPNGEGVTDIDDIINEQEPVVVDDNNNNEPPVNDDPEDGKKVEDPTKKDPNAKDDNSPIPSGVLNSSESPTNDPNNDNNDPIVENEPDDADVIEAQQVGLLFDAIGTSLGWNMNDIDENDRPLTVDDLTEYFKDVVNQNSVPKYADERIQALDEYVKNGGRFEDFYSKQQEALSLDGINLEDETNQKQVLREFLQRNGYNNEQINKKIERYEDSDMLYEESEDALNRLKQLRQIEIEENTKLQEQYAKEQEERSRAFLQEVTNDINQLNDIRGIQIPKEDRRALYDYIFKVDQTGQSQYTKDFNANLSKNLIESAYFTMKADTLIQNAAKRGETSAADKLRKMLRHSAKNHSTYNADDKQKSATDLISGMF